MKYRQLFDKKHIFYEVLNETYRQSKLRDCHKYIQHGNTSVYKHSVYVALYSYILAQKLKIRVNERDLIRGALLHDYFLYDWHEKDKNHSWHGFTHPKRALKNAQKEFALSVIEEDIICRHMFPLTIIPPTTVEGFIVCLADKICCVSEFFNV